MSKMIHLDGPYNNGLALFHDENGLYGYVDRNNNIIIKAKYKKARPFSNGIAVVTNIFNQTYVIDTYGKRIDANNYEIKKMKIVEIRKFSEDCAAIRSENNLWGFILKDGTIMIKPEYKEVSDFKNGVAIVKQRNDKYTVINKSNRMLTDKDYDIIYEYVDGYAVVGECRTTVEVLDEYKDIYSYGIITLNGNELLRCEYDEILPSYKGTIVVGKHSYERYSVFNKDLKLLSNVGADKIYPFNNGYAICKWDKTYQLMNTKGKYVVFKFRLEGKDYSVFEFDYIKEVNYKDDIYHIIDAINPENANEIFSFLAKNGEIIYGPVRDNRLYYRQMHIKENNNGTFNILREEKNGTIRTGLIDENGNFLVPILVNSANMIENGLVTYEGYGIHFRPKNDKDISNAKRVPYSKVEGLEGSFAAIADYELSNINYGKKVYIDSNGNEMFNGLKFDSGTYFHDGYAVCKSEKIDEESNDLFKYYEYYILDKDGIKFTLPNRQIYNISDVRQIKGPVFKVTLNDNETSYLINAENHKIQKILFKNAKYDSGYIIATIPYQTDSNNYFLYRDVIYDMSLNKCAILPQRANNGEIKVISDEIISMSDSYGTKIYNININQESNYLTYEEYVKVSRLSLSLVEEERRRRGLY